MNNFERPDSNPSLDSIRRILVTGASGGLGTALIEMILGNSPLIIGAHGRSIKAIKTNDKIIPIEKELETGADCESVVQTFIEKAGGIDALVVLSGGIHFSGHWKDMPESAWNDDISLNLNMPFFLSKAAMKEMYHQGNGGRIILTGTESALHGGSATSFPYAIAKRATECMVQGLAREGAPQGILVNGVRLGYIKSGFHQRWHSRTEEEMQNRAELVPLKRGGHPDEAAALIVYLLSGWTQFITGQMIPLTGGDWL